MRTIFTLSLMLILRVYSFAQQPEQYFDYKWNICSKKEASFYTSSLSTDSGFVVVDYYISNHTPQMVGKFVSANKKVKNGHFTYYHPNGIVSSRGNYEFGKQIGEWIYFSSKGQKMNIAYYSNGELTGIKKSWFLNGLLADSMYFGSNFAYQKTWFDNKNISSEGQWEASGEHRKGLWTFYHKNGAKSAIVKYNNLGKLISGQYFNEQQEDVTETAVVNRPAQFKNGIHDWNNYLTANLKFPKTETLKRNYIARVVVSFIVNEDGIVEFAEVKVPFKDAYDKIALDIIEKSPRWQPAMSQNRRIKSYFEVPITFRMD